MQFAGAASVVQLTEMTLDEVAVADRAVGAEGTALQVGVSVVVEACAEAADVPSASIATTV